jgi:saccharopine dehydrogenase-like NADP-dependent oxidoreductase
LIFVKLLIVGADGVGSAAAKIAARRPFLTDVLIADYDHDRAQRAAADTADASQVSPRDVVAAALPDPAELGDKMHGKTCAGLWVRGTDKQGLP